MSEVRRYTAEEITHYLTAGFAGPLLVSTVGFILYGTTCYQFFTYILGMAKKDPRFTKSWVSTVMLLNSAATLHQVYFNWLYSIETFTSASRDTSIVNGNVVILYSVVIMLVQMFWLACVEQMSTSNVNLWFIVPIAFASFCSFSLAISVGAVSAVQYLPTGAWPNPTVSILLRTVLSLDLFIDLSILVLILTQLRRMKREINHLRKTLSKLSYIFFGMASLSTLMIIAEFIINAPQSGYGTSWQPFVLTFAPIISPLYMSSMLSILNARGELWSGKHDASEQDELEEDTREDQRPQMNFTNEVYSRAADRDSRQLPLRNHAATEPAIDIERETGSRRSSVEGCDDQRRYGNDGNDGNADQVLSAQFGIQTI